MQPRRMEAPFPDLVETSMAQIPLEGVCRGQRDGEGPCSGRHRRWHSQGGDGSPSGHGHHPKSLCGLLPVMLAQHGCLVVSPFDERAAHEERYPRREAAATLGG